VERFAGVGSSCIFRCGVAEKELEPYVLQTESSSTLKASGTNDDPLPVKRTMRILGLDLL
jgi:hypothetical protein